MTSLTKQLVSQHGAQGPRPPCSPALSSMHSLGLHLTQPSLQNSPSPLGSQVAIRPPPPPTPCYVPGLPSRVTRCTRSHVHTSSSVTWAFPSSSPQAHELVLQLIKGNGAVSGEGGAACAWRAGEAGVHVST